MFLYSLRIATPVLSLAVIACAARADIEEIPAPLDSCTIDVWCLAGRVIDARSGQAMGGAAILASGPQQCFTTADRAGAFTLLCRRAGTLQIRVTRPGYLTRTITGTFVAGKSYRLAVLLTPAGPYAAPARRRVPN